ncbi:MAG: DUF6273 domain-containing protein [Micrococcales bacterium]|nr:DUF6273 domain-containing protein [Micrococcales bacterium]
MGSLGRTGGDDQPAPQSLEDQVAELKAARAHQTDDVDTVPLWGTAPDECGVLDAGCVQADQVGDAVPLWGTVSENRYRRATVQDAPVVDYQSRAASTTAEVVDVCRQIAGRTWSAGSPPVQLGGIYWRVLDVVRKRGGQRALLLAARVVARAPYHRAGVEVTWERCDLRRWLNDEFCSSLGEPVASRVVESRVRNEASWVWKTPGGNDTTDRVFLLSMQEAVEHLAGADWKVFRESVVLELGDRATGTDEDGASAWWWLRSPGSTPVLAARVLDDGVLNARGYSVSWTGGGVRPAFWLNLRP